MYICIYIYISTIYIIYTYVYMYIYIIYIHMYIYIENQQYRYRNTSSQAASASLLAALARAEADAAEAVSTPRHLQWDVCRNSMFGRVVMVLQADYHQYEGQQDIEHGHTMENGVVLWPMLKPLIYQGYICFGCTRNIDNSSYIHICIHIDIKSS